MGREHRIIYQFRLRKASLPRLVMWVAGTGFPKAQKKPVPDIISVTVEFLLYKDF